MISTCDQTIKTGDPTTSICYRRAALVGSPGKVIEGPILRENIAFVEFFPWLFDNTWGPDNCSFVMSQSDMMLALHSVRDGGTGEDQTSLPGQVVDPLPRTADGSRRRAEWRLGALRAVEDEEELRALSPQKLPLSMAASLRNSAVAIGHIELRHRSYGAPLSTMKAQSAWAIMPRVTSMELQKRGRYLRRRVNGELELVFLP
jgi:hypothetical protein